MLDPMPGPLHAPTAPRLREHLPLAVGAVALVTLAAFADRAVGTALPSVVRDFDAVSAFGVINAAPAASFLLMLSFAGSWADRRGPRGPLRVGVVVFALAQTLVALAPRVEVVVAGRVLSGVAEALLDVSLMVVVARVLPEALRPRMFSLLSAAWVLPSVFGPVVTGVVTEQVGWRWVFVVMALLVWPMWLLLRRSAGTKMVGPVAGTVAGTAQGGGSRALPSVVAAAALFGLTLAGEQLGRRPVGAAVAAAVCAVVLVAAAVRLLPPGTFRLARGLPALVASRGLVSASFGGVSAFLPLLLTLVHGFRPVTAGIGLTVTGLAWAFGSWVQGHDLPWPREQVLRAGSALLALGLAGTTLLAWPHVPVWIGLLGWTVAGVGIGVTASTSSVLVLGMSAPAEQGRNHGSVQVAMSSGLAVAFAVGGALVAVGAPTPGTSSFGPLLVGAAVVATLAALITGRVQR